jgi:hypothetical protein
MAATTQIEASRPNRSATTPATKRADGEAAVTPEPVDPDGGGPPGGVGHIADGGEQRRIHHCRPGAQDEGAGGPRPEPLHDGDEPDGGGLRPISGSDQPLAADPVGQSAGEELADTPHRRVEGGEDPDLRDRQSGAREEDRKDAPGEAVVEVVHQPPFFLGMAFAGLGLGLSAIFVRETHGHARHEARLHVDTSAAAHAGLSTREVFVLTSFKEKALSAASQASGSVHCEPLLDRLGEGRRARRVIAGGWRSRIGSVRACRHVNGPAGKDARRATAAVFGRSAGPSSWRDGTSGPSPPPGACSEG